MQHRILSSGSLSPALAGWGAVQEETLPPAAPGSRAHHHIGGSADGCPPLRRVRTRVRSQNATWRPLPGCCDPHPGRGGGRRRVFAVPSREGTKQPCGTPTPWHELAQRELSSLTSEVPAWSVPGATECIGATAAPIRSHTVTRLSDAGRLMPPIFSLSARKP